MRKKVIKLLVWLLNKVRNDDLNNGFEMENQPCYNKEGKFIGWFSRSMAVAVLFIAKIEEAICMFLHLKEEKELLISKVIGIALVAISRFMKR